MSANNQIIIRRKQNGLYEVRHCWVEDGTIEENTIEIVADDIDGLDNASNKANKFIEQVEDEGGYVEYGLRIIPEK